MTIDYYHTLKPTNLWTVANPIPSEYDFAGIVAVKRPYVGRRHSAALRINRNHAADKRCSYDDKGKCSQRFQCFQEICSVYLAMGVLLSGFIP